MAPGASLAMHDTDRPLITPPMRCCDWKCIRLHPRKHWVFRFSPGRLLL